MLSKRQKTRAQKIYDLILENDYFEEAYKAYPKSNWEQAQDATWFVLERVEQNLLTDSELKTWEDDGLYEELSEMIFAGFT